MSTPNSATDSLDRQYALDIPILEQPKAIVRGAHLPDAIRDESLADLFEHTARTYPDKIALTFGCQSLTYAALDAQANLLADRLLHKGAQAGTLVGLWLMRGLDLLIAQLAICKTGAGWLPLDADIPPERILVCLEDAQAIGLLTIDDFAPVVQKWLDQAHIPLWTVEQLRASMPDRAVYPEQNWLRRTPTHQHNPVRDPAYVIYTSGSTGKPKGILISQGSICHFLRSENARLGITAEDKVYQGFSVSFDMSFEEIWMSYLVGASLWIAPKAMIADPDALYQVLVEQRITVLHAVPTLVALLPDDVPNVRIMNLGGEMCPDAVVRRFAKPAHIPQRQLFNTYGPTEATVSASLALLQPHDPVTIGIPLPNYGMLVRSEAGEVLDLDEVGELCIFGRGVALGYLGRPDLTAEKFIDNPYARNEDEKILYRTGDLAKISATGEIFMFGRADDQVKVRGFRVELGEIESALVDIDGIATAAVVLRSLNDVDQLVAFLVSDEKAIEVHALSSPVQSQHDLRQRLRQRLPSYMIPARFEWLLDSQVPRLPSGKIDRKTLKVLPLAAIDDSMSGDEPADDAEMVLFDKLKQILGVSQISLQADFFDDLGGHSLLVARLISQLRQHPAYSLLTIGDIYQARTVNAIADRMRALSTPLADTDAALDKPERYRASWGQRCIATVFQTLALPFIICLQIMKWLAPFFTYHYFTGDVSDSIWTAVALSLLVYVAVEALGFGLAILGNRLLVSGIKVGRYPLWGSVYLRWWLADRLIDLAPSYLLSGSSLYPLYLRALGAQIGQAVTIGSITIRNPHLLSLGDRVDIGNGVNLDNTYVEKGWLNIGQITVGSDSYIGSYSVLEGSVVVGQNCYVEGLSALIDGTQLPDQSAWHGAPLEPMSMPAALTDQTIQRSAMHIGLHLYYLMGMIIISCLFFIPIFPTFMFVDWLDDQLVIPLLQGNAMYWVALRYSLLAIPAAIIMVIFTMLISAAIRWLTMPDLHEGHYPVHGSLYRRRWLSNLIQESSLQVMHGIYATVYAPIWYRLLGAKVGKNAEISTAMGVVPEMLTLGDDSFIADAVMLGDEEVRQGVMTLRATQVGHGSFVGNGAYVPDGSNIPDGVLIGVQSKVPSNALMQSNETWFGTPSIKLPAREVVSGFSHQLTFMPHLSRRLARAFIEGLRIVIPLAFMTGVGYMIVEEVLNIEAKYDLITALWSLVGCGLLFGLGSLLFVALLKWTMLGHYRARSAPMWTLFVWLSEAVTSLYESIAVPNIVNYLRGTIYLPFALRLMGAKIGKRAWLDSTDMTEFDCVTLGDDVEFNNHTGPQTHLFEDRIMKIGQVRIGDRVCVRSRSTILYDTQVNHDVVLEPMTLIMKGEEIPAQSIWSGSPAQPMRQSSTSRHTAS